VRGGAQGIKFCTGDRELKDSGTLPAGLRDFRPPHSSLPLCGREEARRNCVIPGSCAQRFQPTWQQRPINSTQLLEDKHSASHRYGAISSAILRQWDLLLPGRVGPLITMLLRSLPQLPAV
jgi:hypothetical protein